MDLDPSSRLHYKAPPLSSITCKNLADLLHLQCRLIWCFLSPCPCWKLHFCTSLYHVMSPMRSIWEKLLCQVGDLVLSSSLLYPGGKATLKDFSKDLKSSSQGKSWGSSLSFSTRVGWRRELPQMSFLLFLTSVFIRIWIALDVLQFQAPFLLCPCFKILLPLLLFSSTLHYFW